VAAYQKATQLDPDNATAYANLADVYNANGRTEKALTAYLRAIELNPKDALSRGSLAGLYRRLGRKREYNQQMKVARKLIAEESEYNQACLEAIDGDADRALAFLRIALEKHQVQREWVRRDPDLVGIRDDPRFQEMVGLI
jgi:tetratricopeptide (TPR) repeat protein